MMAGVLKFLKFLKTSNRTFAIVFGIASVFMICDFLLLATSLGLHWWRPVWGQAVNRAMFFGLVLLSAVYSLFSVLRLWINVRHYRNRWYDIILVQKLIVSAEASALLVLCATWGVLVLTSQPSFLILRLIGMVWTSTFVVLAVSQIYWMWRIKREASDRQ